VQLTKTTEIKLPDGCITVLFTPGHTNDSLCFRDKENKLLFAGDTIMGGEIGRCDYHSGGRRETYYRTIIHLLQLLPWETKIFPGHRLNHYSELPPYLWSEEMRENLCLQYAALCDKSAFDKELKGLSKVRLDLG
jgi:glyoxylase-like metal-dependent hydrolase (beta-lactamase superfamily II)